MFGTQNGMKKKNGQHEFPKASGKLAQQRRMRKATGAPSCDEAAFVWKSSGGEKLLQLTA